jgi:two-component system, sensor histidine kinase RegB
MAVAQAMAELVGRRDRPGTQSPSLVKQRTLVLIRWIAVGGQAATLCIVHFGMGMPVPIVPALAIVGASALLNLFVGRGRGMRARLSNAGATIYLAYDVLQLTLLLYLTGGLVNPFAILILAPVMVSATVLSRTSTIALGLLTGLSVSALAFIRLPLPWPEGPFTPPALYVMGIWLAIVSSAMFIGAYVGSVSEEARRMSGALGATQLALAREQRLASLGALAAAAAHELGSPLATIALTSKELARDLPEGSPLREDVDLLISQSVRCRDILAELGRAPEADKGSPFGNMPLSALVEDAAEPHRNPAIKLVLDAAPAAGAPEDSPEPSVSRSPEIVHGLGNLIQNAIQFARNEVVVRQRWDFDEVVVEVMDDGPGIPSYLLERIGEPYVSGRDQGGHHMGLGVFIAQNLLERTGGELQFSNRAEGGASVAVRWKRGIIERTTEREGGT